MYLSTVQHSPETEGNVCSTSVPHKKIPEYSQLADETYLNLKPIYICEKMFFSDFQISHFLVPFLAEKHEKWPNFSPKSGSYAKLSIFVHF